MTRKRGPASAAAAEAPAPASAGTSGCGPSATSCKGSVREVAGVGFAFFQ